MCIYIYIYIYRSTHNTMIRIIITRAPTRRESTRRRSTWIGPSRQRNDTMWPMLYPGKNWFGSVRFGSGLFGDSSVCFGSVPKCVFSRFVAVRPAFFGRFVARSGSVRFVSTSGSGRFRNIKRFGSVRPVLFGFLFLPVKWHTASLFLSKEQPVQGSLLRF